MKITITAEKFYKKLKSILKKWPDASLRLISDVSGNTPGSVSWNLQSLKKGKFIKRNKLGNLVALK